MNMYEKMIDGILVRKPLDKIVIEKNGMRTYNPTEAMVVEDGWKLYDPEDDVIEKPKETAEEKLRKAKEALLEQIGAYDESLNINGCFIQCEYGTFVYWADKHDRDSLRNAVQKCIVVDRETYRLDLRDFNLSLSIPCHKLLDMLDELEIYAIDCYNRTTDHIYAVRALKTLKEVEDYDFTTGYPNQLRFVL